MLPLPHRDRKICEIVLKSGPTLLETQNTASSSSSRKFKKREIYSFEERETGHKVVTAGPPLPLYAAGHGEASLCIPGRRNVGKRRTTPLDLRSLTDSE